MMPSGAEGTAAPEHQTLNTAKGMPVQLGRVDGAANSCDEAGVVWRGEDMPRRGKGTG